jgi:GNAT superfamily N-acetyltransferase
LALQDGFLEPQRRRAAEIFYDAFATKLEPIVGAREPAVEMISRALQPDRVICAMVDGELVGLVGLAYAGREMVRFTWSNLASEHGWIRAAPRAIVARFALGSTRTNRCSETDVTIEGIAVDSSMRGRGIGTRLMDGVFESARAKGFDSIRLDVVDTNPEARRLYERLGFKAEKTMRVPWIDRILGFSSWTVMVRQVRDPST